MNKKETDRILVKEYSTHEVFFHGKLADTILMLQEFKNEGGWEGIAIGPYSYDDYNLYLYKYRPETDKEYDERMKLEEKLKQKNAKNEAKRRKLYEELKKEFG